MSDIQNYFMAGEKTKAAYNQYSYAGEHLTNCQIMERLAEIKSQSEPLDSLLKKAMSERDRLYAAAYYVAVGRMPEILSAKGEGK